MSKRVFAIEFGGKGLIESYVLHKASKGNPCKRDIIRLVGRNSSGKDFIYCDMTPEEAILLSHALLKAHTHYTIKKWNNFYKKRKKKNGTKG